MIIIKSIIASVFIFLFTACTTHQVEPRMNMTAPKYIQDITQKNNQLTSNKTHDGSVYGQGSNPLFADKKAMNINDIVTVVINETTYQSSQGNKKITDSSVNDLGGGLFSSTNPKSLAGRISQGLNPVSDIGFKTNSKNAFNAQGSQSHNETFTATVSARIVRILNNGNYFISGSRELLLNGAKQVVYITGVIRPYDIDQANTIDSKYIADAKILYETQGDIKQATQKPWGSRLIESAWPF